ncbi:MAG TPA: lytic murein transglycosylase [Thermoleophilaceae bacterium]|nr:lytic murein transglycosylase [Thermoleophilaceae bacterium]
MLLTAALVAATVAYFTVPATPANAELRTVTVRLADGSLTTVTVDVPPGTPLDQVQLPAPPPTPTVTTPVPVPNPTSPSSPAPNPSNPSNPTGGGGGGQQPGDITTTPDQIPNASDKGGSQAGSGDKKKAKPNALGDIPNAEPQREVKKKLDKVNEKLRNPDGSPAATNPTFFDALPGPAVASGVPNFVIQKFRVPIFLLPIYQAAGIQYGIRWEVLAAINEIETDYGRNLNVSSAGAVGWMQFLPSTWKSWGVDANKDGRKDPFNPVDAIFSAARYLRAAGGDQDIQKAIFSYNHATWYVDSVMLRARMIAGVPADLVGSLTGLTEGHFPVYARARYADDLAEKDAIKRVKRGANAANVIGSNSQRVGIDIFARRGAPVVAVNDGVVKKIGVSKKIGRYVVLQDVYGNQYTYGNLGRVSKLYPVPKADLSKLKTTAKALQANQQQKRHDPKPTTPASAGRQVNAPTATSTAKKRVAAKAKKTRIAASHAAPAPAPQAVERERLFAHPTRAGAKDAGGLEQVLLSKAKRGAYATFDNVSSRPLRFDPKRMRLARLKKSSHVVGGTVLGRVGRPSPTKAAHIYFQIRPAGKGAPLIDPKPILDGWKLLEATAIYRASGRNALYDPNGNDNLSIGQVMLLPKSMLERRVLNDPRIDIYQGGRDDIRTGQIDRRVLATLEYLAESGFNPTVSCLKSGHSEMTTSGNVSEHWTGNAVDISAVNGIPILGHQDPGGIADQVVRRLMTLQGTMMPHQIISLLDYGANTLALPDHADHIHVGFKPLFGTNAKLGMQALAVLKPGQWNNLISRLSKIDNPVVPTKPSKYSIKVPKTDHGAPVGND